MSPYRTAPVVASQKAPRASWWRRLTHRDVTRRLEIRRLRRAAHAEAPWAPWSACNNLAVAMHGAARKRGIDGDIDAMIVAVIRREIAEMRQRMMPAPIPSGTLRR